MQAKPKVIDWKVLYSTSKKADLLFINKDNRVFVKAFLKGGYYLWLNNNWMPINQYGYFINGFVKDGKVHLVFGAEPCGAQPYIDIYTVEKDITLEEHIKIEDYLIITDVIYAPEEKDILYLLGCRRQTSSNPVEAMNFWLSGGHGILYDKPLLAEIQGRKLISCEMLRYGGKRNESYLIKEVMTGNNKIHFFGFRTQKQIGSGNYPENIPDVLYYTEYSTKKKKVVRTQDIYEKNPSFDKKGELRQGAYWHISTDNFNDDLFIVFSWHKMHSAIDIERNVIEMKIDTDSPIYYSQNNGKGFGNVETIGNGILPLVRADSTGNVHVIWTDSEGNIVHKARKDGKWGDEQIVLDNVIEVGVVWEGMRQGEWFLQNMCAEFDNDNNLNLVFTSNRKLVLAKVRLD